MQSGTRLEANRSKKHWPSDIVINSWIASLREWYYILYSVECEDILILALSGVLESWPPADADPHFCILQQNSVPKAALFDYWLLAPEYVHMGGRCTHCCLSLLID